MTKVNKVVCYIFIITLFYNCSNKKDSKTLMFSNYLNSQFNIQIPNEKHYYFVFPQFGCSGCITSNFLEIQDYLNCEVISIIISNKNLLSYKHLEGGTHLYDTQGKIDILNLGIANVAIIETQNKIVTKIHSLSVTEKVTDIIDITSICPH